MAKKQRRVNRRKKQQLEVVKTSTGMEEFAKSTADLMTKLCKLAHDSEMESIAFEAFRHQIQEVLDEDQRDLIEKLCNEVSNDLQNIRGSEKSSSNGPNENDPSIGTTAEPEPPPKEEEKPKKEAVTDTPPSEDSISLFGFGVRFSQSPTKHAVDDCLMNPDRLLANSSPDGFLSKRDIATEIGSHPDTVRKRIAEIVKNCKWFECKFSSDQLKIQKYKIGDAGTGVGVHLLEQVHQDGSKTYKIETTTSE